MLHTCTLLHELLVCFICLLCFAAGFWLLYVCMSVHMPVCTDKQAWCAETFVTRDVQDHQLCLHGRHAPVIHVLPACVLSPVQLLCTDKVVTCMSCIISCSPPVTHPFYHSRLQRKLDQC